MPRTAPAPNIPAIPGMNPGVLVMGGGGAGGGAGAGGGKGKGGKKGAGTGDGQESANGDKKDTGSCGQGAGAGCSNCGSHVTAGDPVDTDTGDVFTLPQHDVLLGGPFNLSIARVYNSKNRNRDIGLGFGWGMALAWSLEVTPRDIIVRKPDGDTVWFPPVAGGSTVQSAGGWTLRATPSGFVMDAKDGFYHHFTTAEHGVARLEGIEDSAGNRVSLTYSPAGLLVEGTDSAGRAIRFERNTSGRIAGMAVHNDQLSRFETFATYEYDASGDLRYVRLRGGYHMEYAYEDHRLTQLTYPNGLRFVFIYDREGRCIETWGNYVDGVDPALDDNLPPYLADGTTVAKGIYHTRIDYHEDGYREVVNAVEVKRLDYNAHGKLDKGVSGGAVTTRTYDEYGRCVERVDGNGNVTRHAYDERGRLVERVDPKGNTTSIRRDEHGRVVGVTDSAGGTVEIGYDLYGNVLFQRDEEGAVSTYEYDRRGMMTAMIAPNGARTTFEYDAHANPITVTQPNGAVWTYTYNAFNRLTSVTDPLSNTTRFELDDAFRVVAEHQAHGGVFRTAYDIMNNVVARVDADGTVVSNRYGGLNLLCETISARGYSFFQKYDREGRFVAAINSKNERWHFERNTLGAITREVTFDGQERAFRVDDGNNCTRLIDGRNRHCDYVWDGNNNATELTFEDESVTFDYDVNDRIQLARNAKCETHLQRNLTGKVIRETHLFDGRTIEVDFTYDVNGRKIGCSTNLGYHEEVKRDGSGARRKHEFTSGASLGFDTDVLGRVVRTRLPSQGSIDTQYHPLGWVVARTVTLDPTLGSLDRSAAFWLTHDFSLAGELRKTSLSTELREYQQDADSNVLAMSANGRVSEAFAYDERCNPIQLQPVADGRRYGPGDQLRSRAGYDYEWDAAGRLIRRTRSTPGGTEQSTFEWSDAGNLVAMNLPNGQRLEFITDAFGRRLEKTLWATELGQKKLLSRTVFVWAGATMIQELRYDETVAESAPEQWLYYYDDQECPVGHERTVADDLSKATTYETLFYVNDANDTPTALVDERGETAAILSRSVWGMTETTGTGASTPLRFKGQYFDEESGLHYNRYRYYDPETGRYISADPLYAEASFNLYRYCINPLTWVDPLGLHTVTNVSLAFSPDGPTITPDPKTTNAGKEGDFHSGYTAKDPGKSDEHCQGVSSGKAYWESHTERKAMRWAELEAERRDLSLKDAQLGMTGELAPCNTCNKAMLEWTKKTGAKVEYTWPTGNKKTYSGGAAKGSPRLNYSTLTDESL